MIKQAPTVAVVTGDIIGSSRYGRADRRKADLLLRAAFRETERRFKGAFRTKVAFRITAGDEFQCVIAQAPRAVHILTFLRAVAATSELRPPLRFRASIGLGAMTVAGRNNPYEEDGPAFVRSRQGFDDFDKPRGPFRWTKLVTGDADRDRVADAVLSLADFLYQGWTTRQWEAVRWAILGGTREAIAHRIQIAHQNVTKRLRASGWLHLEVALDFLEELLKRDLCTHSGMQKLDAPP